MVVEQLDQGTVATAIPPDDRCQPKLREVLTRWKLGRATNEELVDASFSAMLEQLDEYRIRALPTVPEAVLAFRRLKPSERTGAELEELKTKYHAFFKQEREVLGRNHANQFTLREVLDWATKKDLETSVLYRIEHLLRAWPKPRQPVDYDASVEI